MEKRRLQATGGSSLTLTLPKTWLERWKLKSKDEVSVKVSGASLVINPMARSRQHNAVTLGVDDKAPDWLLREIIGAYIAGNDKIILAGSRITSEQNQIIRQTVQQLFGFEILEESSISIVARSVVDLTLFPVGENARRIFAICRSMLEDALRAAQTDDKELAQEVVLRDQEVNKMVYAIQRRLIQVLDGHIDGNAKELNYYSNVAQQLERIGDRAVMIGKLAMGGRTEPIQLSKSFPAIRDGLAELLDDVESLLDRPHIDLAHEILDKNPRLAPLMYSSARIKETYEGAVVEDSFDRTRGRLMNVAELTIDYLMQT